MSAAAPVSQTVPSNQPDPLAQGMADIHTQIALDNDDDELAFNASADIPPGPLPARYTELKPKSVVVDEEDVEEVEYIPPRPVQRFRSVGNPAFKVVGATPKRPSRFRTVGSPTYTTIKASISSMAELYAGKGNAEDPERPETLMEDNESESATNADDTSTIVDHEELDMSLYPLYKELNGKLAAVHIESSGVVTELTACYSPLCQSGAAKHCACYSFVCPNRASGVKLSETGCYSPRCGEAGQTSCYSFVCPNRIPAKAVEPSNEKAGTVKTTDPRL